MFSFSVILVILFSLFNVAIIAMCAAGLKKIFEVRKSGASSDAHMKELHLNVVHTLGHVAVFANHIKTAEVRSPTPLPFLTHCSLSPPPPCSPCGGEIVGRRPGGERRR